jgi:anti-sigma B factor antagonist
MDSGQIKVDQRDGVAVIALVGEHDLSTAPDVDAALRLPKAGLVVDLSPTTFLDSSILGVVVAVARDAEQRQVPFTVVIPDDSGSPARRIFDLTGLASALSVATDIATAIDGGNSSTAPTSG